MADKKLTLLPALTDPVGTDVMMIVDDVTGTPVSKKIEVEDLFGATSQLSVGKVDISSTSSLELTSTTTTNITATGGVVVTGDINVVNSFISLASSATANGGAAATIDNTNSGGIPVGTILWDNTKLYVVVASSGADAIKSVDLTAV